MQNTTADKRSGLRIPIVARLLRLSRRRAGSRFSGLTLRLLEMD
jgi:hypothetical protein